MDRSPHLAAACAVLAAVFMPEAGFLDRPAKRVPPALARAARDAARAQGLDEDFFQAVVWAEGGRLGDRSSGIARGPAQITRAAAESDCPEVPWHAVRTRDAANLECGAVILSRRSRRWLGRKPDPMLAASLYNTKSSHWASIAARRKVPPFPETVAYVTRISRYYCQFTGRRLLAPSRHLDAGMLPLSRRVDREMERELLLEGQAPRPGCSPY